MRLYKSKYPDGSSVDEALDKANSALQPDAISSVVCSNNDPRLSDSRTPKAHKSNHAIGGADALTPADIGAATAAQGSKAESALQPASIDDTSTAANKLWSAQKISGELGNISAALDALNGESV